MVRAAPRGQSICTSTLPANPVVWRVACYRHRSCSPYLLCPRRPAGDTFLSLNLLLNESPLRSRRSICVSTGAPFLPLTYPVASLLHLAVPQTSRPHSLCRYHQSVVRVAAAGGLYSTRTRADRPVQSICTSRGQRVPLSVAPDRACRQRQDSVQQSRMHVLELFCSLLRCMRNAPRCPMYIWTKGGRKDQHRPRRGRALRCCERIATLGTIDRGILVK